MTLITRIWDNNRIIMAGDKQLNKPNWERHDSTCCKIIFLKDINAALGLSGNLKEGDYIFKEVLKDIYSEKMYNNLDEYLEAVKDYYEKNRPKGLEDVLSLLMASTFRDGKPINYSLVFKFTNKSFDPDYYPTPLIIQKWCNDLICSLITNIVGCRCDSIDPFTQIDTNWNYRKDDNQHSAKIFLTILNCVKSINFRNGFDMLKIVDVCSFFIEVYGKIILQCYDRASRETELLSVGECNGIISLQKDGTKSDFIYQEGKCFDDHVW